MITVEHIHHSRDHISAFDDKYCIIATLSNGSKTGVSTIINRRDEKYWNFRDENDDIIFSVSAQERSLREISEQLFLEYLKKHYGKD